MKSEATWQIAITTMLLASMAATAAALDVPALVLKAQQERIAAIEKAKQSSVSVFAGGGQGGGSGVVITPDGYALTNFHVTTPAGNYMQCSMPDGKLYDAVLVGLDPTGDVALIKLLGREDFPAATLADSDKVRVGDWCFAVGNPFLLATDFQPTVTWGIVSGVHRYQYPAGTLLEYADCIQTDAAINPGNSGGPLYDANGDLIGINGRGSFEKRGRVNVGVGYAISINQIKHFLGYLRSGRIVDHATLGASVITDEDGRVVVNDLLESSDAFRRGLRYGDEIVSFGSRPIRTVNAFKNVLGIFPRGWRVPLSYRREGKRHDIWVRLQGVHSREELIAKVQGGPREARPPRNPGDDPEKDDEGDEKDDEGQDKPKLPLPHPMPAKKPLPDHVKEVFQERTGYANYHFNLLNRDRIWKAFLSHGDFSKYTGDWQLVGELEDGGAIQITLLDKQASATFPAGQTEVDLEKDLDTQLGPTDSGGLVVALAMWKRLLALGPERFGEVYYLGTAPVPGAKSLADQVDVVIGTYDVVECQYYFDPETGRLLCLEMYPSKDADSCQVHFGDYREQNGHMIPHRLEIRHGDDVFAVITLKSIKLPPPAENEA